MGHSQKGEVTTWRVRFRSIVFRHLLQYSGQPVAAAQTSTPLTTVTKGIDDMFKKYFGDQRKQETTTPGSDPGGDALLRTIEERRQEDPLVGAKIGGKEVAQRLIDALKGERGVHVETLLACIGSLGGYACHMAIRDVLVKSGKVKEAEAFVVVGGADGRKYYFGDLVNRPLVEDPVSFWALVGGAAQHLDGDGLPDVKGIFQHVSSTVGGDEFGIPQVPEQHKPGDTPLNLVRVLWPALLPLVDSFCASPVERPYLFGISAQEVIEMGKDVIAPGVAARLIMECAVPMSKIGPEWLEN